jgi:hypothetical protein
VEEACDPQTHPMGADQRPSKLAYLCSSPVSEALLQWNRSSFTATGQRETTSMSITRRSHRKSSIRREVAESRSGGVIAGPVANQGAKLIKP